MIKGGSNCKTAIQSTVLHRHLLCRHHPSLTHFHSTHRAGQRSPGRLVWVCFPQCCTWETAAALPNEAEKSWSPAALSNQPKGLRLMNSEKRQHWACLLIMGRAYPTGSGSHVTEQGRREASLGLLIRMKSQAQWEPTCQSSKLWSIKCCFP